MTSDPLPILFQVIDPHTNEYIARLKDEPVFLALAQKVLDYLGRTGDQKNMPKIALRLIEHFYFKVCRWTQGLIVEVQHYDEINEHAHILREICC